jgi:hypothetical protein
MWKVTGSENERVSRGIVEEDEVSDRYRVGTVSSVGAGGDEKK